MKRGIAAIAALGVAVIASGCSGTQSCADYVRETRSGDSRYVEQTFSDGNFHKGIVGQIINGEDSVYAYWECSLSDSGPEITMYEIAAN